MTHRNKMTWQCGDRSVDLGARTFIMGILNVTPDSFSDGGDYGSPEKAAERALRMVEEGADIVDVGGESTRPGAESVDEQEECERVVPVIERIVAEADVLVSVDTAKASVARAAVAAGAHIINDVTACTGDPEMEDVLQSSEAGVVLMHMQGTPRTMQLEPTYGNVVEEVCSYLRDRAAHLQAHGVARDRMTLDPGIGFGKSVRHNVSLLAHLDEVAGLGLPVLVGLSRKSFLGQLTESEVGERLAASLAGMAYAVKQGAHIIRVHDVKESCDVARIIDTLVAEEVSEWRS